MREVLFLSLLAAVLLYGPRTFNLDGDLGRHITIGSYMLESRSIPRTDIFSHTMNGQPLTPHEWLAQVLFAAAHKFLGLSGAVLLTALVVSAAFVVVFEDSLGRSQAPALSLMITILAAAAASLHWLARPHVFTFVFLALWTLLLERVRDRQATSIWQFALLMLLWANTHGAFIAGFVTWGAYAGGELIEAWKKRQWNGGRFRSWALIGLTSLAATFVNPAGVQLWGTSLGFVSNRYLVSHTQEYLPPDFHAPVTWLFLLLVALSVFIIARKRLTPPAAHSLLVAGWAAMGFYSARNIPLFTIVAAPILAEALAGMTGAQWQEIENKLLITDRCLRGGMWALGGILAAVIFLSKPAMQRYNSFDPARFPVEAVNWLDQHPQPGNVFNHFPWGGYLLYRQWPETLVFIDGQTDFYGEPLTREYETLINTVDGWQSILARYRVEWAILPATSPLAGALSEAGWETLYQDTTAVILRDAP